MGKLRRSDSLNYTYQKALIWLLSLFLMNLLSAEKNQKQKQNSLMLKIPEG